MNSNKPQWSPRVPREKILRLYELDAKGITDEALIDDVAFSFFVRCKDIIVVSKAAFEAEVECPQCQNIIKRKSGNNELLICNKCKWQITWQEYFDSYHRTQLHGGGGYAEGVFQNFIRQLPLCKTPKEKMLLIDRIIHECHKSIVNEKGEQLYTRPIAVNLIDGNMTQVIAFLENLPNCPDPSMRQNLAEWRRKVLSAMNENDKKKWMPK